MRGKPRRHGNRVVVEDGCAIVFPLRELHAASAENNDRRYELENRHHQAPRSVLGGQRLYRGLRPPLRQFGGGEPSRPTAGVARRVDDVLEERALGFVEL